MTDLEPSVVDNLDQRLLSHGVRPTAQRLRIASLLLGRPQHLSAEQVLAGLRNQGMRVSKATIYNTLNLFSRHGIIREMAVDSARLVYDSTTGVHHHFYNVDTGELTDIDAAQVELRKLPPLPEGTEAASVELLIRIRRKS